MTPKELMDMIRRSAHDFISYDRANLKEGDFFGFYTEEKSHSYYSVIDFVADYNLGGLSSQKNGRCDKYFLIDNNTLLHFTDTDEAMLKASDMFNDRHPKDVYQISYADKEKFYRRINNLEILLD